MKRRGILIGLAAAVLAITAPAAHAGSYTVVACGAPDNRSWNSVAAVGISADESCPGSTTMGNSAAGNARVPDGAAGSTTFTAPSGMRIADFSLTRQLTYRNGAPASGTRRLYAIYRLGGTVFAGAGHYDNATRDRLNAARSWYGYPENNVVVPRSTVSRASFPALAGYAGTATTLQIAVGCFNGSANTACTVAPSGGIAHLLWGAQVVLNDPTAAGRRRLRLGAAGRRPALRLRRRDARRHRQRRHPARPDHRRHHRHRQRRRAGGLRGRLPHRERRDLLVPPRQGVPEPRATSSCARPRCRPGGAR